MSSRIASHIEGIPLLLNNGADEEEIVAAVLNDNTGSTCTNEDMSTTDSITSTTSTLQKNDSPQAASLPSPKLPSGDSSRGIGILVVIVYHMGYESFMNAWVDISLFFSLSGFLITKTTVESIDRQGHMDICKFWAKRISRIFPCVLLVINLIVISQKFPFRHNDGDTFQREATDLWYATIFATNYNLVYLQPDDYFDEFSSPSITRHLWTLSIEEQYYVIWPFIMWALSKLAHRFRSCTSATEEVKARPGSIQSSQMKNIIMFVWILDIVVMVSSYFTSWATIDSMGVTAAYYSTWCRMGDIAAGGFAYTSARLMPWIARRWYEDPTLPPISTKERIIYETMTLLVLLSITILPMSNIAKDDMFMMYFRYLRFGLSFLVFCNVGASIQLLHKPLPKWAIASRIMDNKLLLLLGTVSYGAYVIHWPLLVFFGDPNGVHRKQVEEGLDVVVVHRRHMTVFQYHMQNLFIFLLTLVVAQTTFFKYEIPFMVKSRVTSPRKTVTVGLLAISFTLVNIWLVTKNLPPMINFENDLNLDSAISLSKRDNRFTPIAMISVSQPVADVLWESLVNVNTRPQRRNYHNIRRVLHDSISFGASDANILIQCKNKAAKRHICDLEWWNNTYWFWLESSILCDDLSTQMDDFYFSRKCDDIIQISEITVSYNSDSNDLDLLTYEEKLRVKECELLFGINILKPDVINQSSLELLKCGNKKNEDTTPLRITMIGESIGLRIGMYWKDYVNLDLPALNYHPTASEFPTITLLNNAAVGGRSAIAFWICKSRYAIRYEFCDGFHERNDMIQSEVYSLETTKADVITIHDMHWALRTDHLPKCFLPKRFDSILAFNILVADAIVNGANSMYYLNQSPYFLGDNNDAYERYKQEMNNFMEMVDTLSCDTFDDSEGINVSVLDWATLICPTVANPGKICKKYGVHGFDDILPDSVHPYGDSGLWLSREVLAVVLAHYGVENNNYSTFEESLKNPLSEQLLTLAPSDGDPALKDLVTTYRICPYEDLSQLEEDIANQSYSLHLSYRDSEYAFIV